MFGGKSNPTNQKNWLRKISDKAPEWYVYYFYWYFVIINILSIDSTSIALLKKDENSNQLILLNIFEWGKYICSFGDSSISLWLKNKINMFYIFKD